MGNKIKIIIPVVLAVILAIAIGICVWQADRNQILSQFPHTPFTFSSTNCSDYVSEDFKLDKYFLINGALYPVSWSADSELVDGGKVIRPENVNTVVTMTASVKVDDKEYSKGYELTLIKDNLLSEFKLPTMDKVEKYYNGERLVAVQIPEKERDNLTIQSAEDAETAVSAMCYWFNYQEGTHYSFVGVQSNLVGRTYTFKQMMDVYPVGDGFITVTTQNDKLATVTVGEWKGEYVYSIPPRTSIDAVVSKVYQKYLVEAIESKGDGVWNIYISTKDDVIEFRMLTIDFSTSEILKDALWVSQEASEWNEQINAIAISEKGQTQAVEIYRFYKDLSERGYSEGKNIHETNLTLSGINGTVDQVAKDNFQKIVDLYYNVLGRDMADGKGKEIQILTNAEWIADNALYSEGLDAFIFGKQNIYPKPISHIFDTTLHEYTHAVFSNIVYGTMCSNAEFLAITEAYSDIMTCSLTDDWKVGEEMGTSEYIRDFTNLNADDKFADALPEKYEDLNWLSYNASYNASMLVRVAYQMRQSGMAAEDIAKIWYQSMFYGYSNSSSYASVKTNVILAATDLGYSESALNVIKTAFSSFGIS